MLRLVVPCFQWGEKATALIAAWKKKFSDLLAEKTEVDLINVQRSTKVIEVSGALTFDF